MRIRNIVFGVILGIHASFALANCAASSLTLTDPAKLQLNADKVMIVTHASSLYDGRISTKFGIDEAVSYAKSRKIPVVYLRDSNPLADYFVSDCQPDHWVRSEDGEVNFDVAPTHVYVAGGHLEECLSRTLHDVLYSWAKQPQRSLTVTYFMDGIYSNGKSISEADPFYADYQRFMGIVTYSRPAGEHFPKLTLLETMGVILKEAQQNAYLERILPHFRRTLGKAYRVELRVSGSQMKVLQRGEGERPPVLRFEFVESADKLSQM